LYYGDDPQDHKMNVESVGPALVAFGRLVRAANAELNGDRASVDVLVDSGFEHRCFSIDLEVIQRVFDQVKDFWTARRSIKRRIY
jgi:hypothetical protein